MSNGNDPWNNEQAPFVGADAEAANAQASAEAGAVGGSPVQGASDPFHADAGSAAGAAAFATAGAPAAGGWGPAGPAYAPAPPPPIGAVGAGSEPNPVLAFLLGLIPGVGAMYNGQIAKGFIHLVVFAVLVTLANNVSGVFGILIAGWIFFQAFEAYHTAKARRDGLPLPNAFGWNDIGERMGLGKNWPFSPGAAAAGTVPPGGRTGTSVGGAPGAAPAAYPPATPGGWANVPPPQAGPAASGVPYAAAAQGAAPNWAGYVPPSAFASAPPAGAGAVGGGAVPVGHGVPYAPVSSGAPYPPYPVADTALAASRLPVGAIWLIGLGALFLLGQWTPLLHVGRVWIPSLVLTGIAGLLFARRMGWTGSAAWTPAAGLPIGARVASAIRVPGILLAIAVLNGLHEAWVVRWDRSWPWLLIVIGVLMVVERVAFRQAASLNDPNQATPTGGL